MRKTATRLTKVKIKTKGLGGVRQKQTFWCVSWPKIGKGRNRQFFKDKKEAETVLQQKLIEQENYGIAGVSFSERHRAEYLECADALQPFGASIRDAVNFYSTASHQPHVPAELVDELLKIKEADLARATLPERFTSRQRNSETSMARLAEITSQQIDDVCVA
jgi:hypothetical protein